MDVIRFSGRFVSMAIRAAIGFPDPPTTSREKQSLVSYSVPLSIGKWLTLPQKSAG
jgi:hypothetical protein